MSDTRPKIKVKKHEEIIHYFIYATAAYFGLQLLLKRKVSAATLIPKTPVATQQETTISYDDPAAADSAITAATANYSTASTAKWMPETFPLRPGMKGSNTKSLQQKLGIGADGIFGAKTTEALRKKYGISTVSKEKFQAIMATKATAGAANNTVNSTLLQMGSRGSNVYRLQKMLGFKDKAQAKKGQPVADSVFGQQTLNALKQKTGKTSITIAQLNAIAMITNGGINTGNMAGTPNELLVASRDTTIFNVNLQPHCVVKKDTVLGRKILDLEDRQRQKTFTQFLTVDGHKRWVDKAAA